MFLAPFAVWEGANSQGTVLNGLIFEVGTQVDTMGTRV